MAKSLCKINTRRMTPMDTKPLSPSERKHLTKPQANKLGEALTAAMLKVNPFSDEAQYLIENSWDQVRDEVVAANVEALNRVLDRKRNTITIRVKVKRGRTGRQVFIDTHRVRSDFNNVADSAPLIPGDGCEEVDFVFFPGKRCMKYSEVEAERQKYGLVRDLEAQAEANRLRPEFADEHPNGDSWQDASGKWCCVYFRRSFEDLFCVDIDKRKRDEEWGVDTWFGGVARKLPSVV